MHFSFLALEWRHRNATKLILRCLSVEKPAKSNRNSTVLVEELPFVWTTEYKSARLYGFETLSDDKRGECLFFCTVKNLLKTQRDVWRGSRGLNVHHVDALLRTKSELKVCLVWESIRFAVREHLLQRRPGGLATFNERRLISFSPSWVGAAPGRPSCRRRARKHFQRQLSADKTDPWEFTGTCLQKAEGRGSPESRSSGV